MYSISVVDLFDGCDGKIYDTQKNKMTEIMHIVNVMHSKWTVAKKQIFLIFLEVGWGGGGEGIILAQFPIENMSDLPVFW